MNIKKIQELIQLMSDNDLTEIEIEQEGSKIHLIKKTGGVVEHQVFAPAPVHHPAPQPVSAPAGDKKEEVGGNLIEIKSPMVGTFYRSPSPEDSPYVQVGDTIHKGDVLCIVEAMKLMNEVKSEIDGKISAISVGNAEAVEFGQTIFLVEPV